MRSVCPGETRRPIHPNIDRRRRMRLHLRSLLAAFLACMLTGCTLLPMQILQPVIAPPAPMPDGGLICTDPRLVDEHAIFGPAVKVQYLLPGDHDLATSRPTRIIGADSGADSFVHYREMVLERVAHKLPAELAGDRVTGVFVDFLTAASGEAQLDAQIADHTLYDQSTIAAERASILRYSSAAKLKHAELKAFARKLFDLQLRHGPADFIGAAPNLAVLSPKARALASTRPPLRTELVAYFKAYYDGKFYDRMSNAIAKPQMPLTLTAGPSPISFSVPDSEIVAAATVLLEFLIDCIDPTPVMVDPTGTTYYPGNSPNEPTALATGFTTSVILPATGCGINLTNVWVLKDLANAASDEVGAIGGLVVNTPGGFGWSLGAFAKISIGDNQTLSDLLKMAASDLALRITLATSYFSLRHVSFSPPPV